MQDKFEILLKELGKAIGIPSLHPDKNQLCKLNVNGVLHVQIEFDPRKERILIATLICDLPPGKFREKALKTALRANGDPYRLGTLAYSERAGKLALFEYLPLVELNGEKCAKFLAKFLEKADSWRLAIEQGAPLPIPDVKKNRPLA